MMIWLLDRTVDWLVITANWLCYFAARLDGVQMRSRVQLQVSRKYHEAQLMENQTVTYSDGTKHGVLPSGQHIRIV